MHTRGMKKSISLIDRINQHLISEETMYVFQVIPPMS